MKPSSVFMMIACILVLYFAAIFFRYEPVPGSENMAGFALWDRFKSRMCVVTFKEPTKIACSLDEYRESKD